MTLLVLCVTCFFNVLFLTLLVSICFVFDVTCFVFYFFFFYFFLLNKLTWVGPCSEDQGEVFVLQEVLDVSHFVVDGDKVVHRSVRALFYSRREIIYESQNSWSNMKMLWFIKINTQYHFHWNQMFYLALKSQKLQNILTNSWNLKSVNQVFFKDLLSLNITCL